MRIFRVKVARVVAPGDGASVGIQATAYAVAPDRAIVPQLIDAFVPEWRGANFEILDEVTGPGPFSTVRVGVGEPRLFTVVRGASKAEVRESLLGVLPDDSPWRVFVEDGWFEIAPVDGERAGVY